MKKVLAALLLAAVVLAGAASAFGFGYAGTGSADRAAQECMGNGYGHGHGHGRQNMGLAVPENAALEQTDVSAEDVKARLESADIEVFTNPRGVTVQRIIIDGEYSGKIVGDYAIDQLEVLSAYQTLNGVKVFLGMDGNVVGFVLLR
ncbi:hypothetical protein [Geoglobus sp.]